MKNYLYVQIEEFDYYNHNKINKYLNTNFFIILDIYLFANIKMKFHKIYAKLINNSKIIFLSL